MWVCSSYSICVCVHFAVSSQYYFSHFVDEETETQKAKESGWAPCANGFILRWVSFLCLPASCTWECEYDVVMPHLLTCWPRHRLHVALHLWVFMRCVGCDLHHYYGKVWTNGWSSGWILGKGRGLATCSVLAFFKSHAPSLVVGSSTGYPTTVVLEGQAKSYFLGEHHWPLQFITHFHPEFL